jgi:hypothetical protein
MEKTELARQAAAAKAHYNLQIDTALQQQARALDEQTNAQMLQLQEMAVQQKSALEGQAAGLKLEFEQRKAQEDMMIRQYEIQKQYYQAQLDLQGKMQQLQPPPAPGVPPGAPPMAPAMMPIPSMTTIAAPPGGMVTVPAGVPFPTAVGMPPPQAYPMMAQTMPPPPAYPMMPPATFQS